MATNKSGMATKIPPISVDPTTGPINYPCYYWVGANGPYFDDSARWASATLDCLGSVVWSPGPHDKLPTPAPAEGGVTVTSWLIDPEDNTKLGLMLSRPLTDDEKAAPTPWRLLVTSSEA